MKNKVIKMTFINTGMTCFAYSIAGMSIYLILGMKNYIAFISILNMLEMIFNFFSGYIQNKFSSINNPLKVLHVSIVFEILYTISHFIADVSILKYTNLFLVFQMISIITNSVCSAFYNIYSERVLCLIYKDDYVLRSKFYSKTKMIRSICSTIGYIINVSLVYYFEKILGFDKTNLLYCILLIHLIFILFDFIITLVERNVVIKYFKSLEEK